MVHSFESQIAIVALVLACVFAFLKGGDAERLASVLVALSWLGCDLIAFLLKDRVSQEARELTLLAMDGVLAVGLLALAFRYAKIWLGVAMLMLSGELALHGVAMGDWGVEYRSYILLNNLLSFALIGLLVVATLMAWRRGGARGPPSTAVDASAA